MMILQFENIIFYDPPPPHLKKEPFTRLDSVTSLFP